MAPVPRNSHLNLTDFQRKSCAHFDTFLPLSGEIARFRLEDLMPARFVSGSGFSRAVKSAKQMGFSP